MYSRKIKLAAGGKKKDKRSGPAAPGSNWGPRIALAEKEKALLGPGQPETLETHKMYGGSVTRKQNPYTNPPNFNQSKRRHEPSSHPMTQLVASPRSNYKKVSVSSLSSQTGSSYNGHNYIYNYVRKSSINTASESAESSRSFFLTHQRQGPPGLHSGRNSCGRSTYILGSNSGSQITLSESMCRKQPLTLIIPRVEEADFENDYEGIERGQDSFPSTRTYCSSSEEDRRNDEELEDEEEDQALRNKNPLPFKSEQIFCNPAIAYGILKISTTQPLIHHAECETENTEERKPQDKEISNDCRVNLRKDQSDDCVTVSDFRNLCTGKNKGNSIGSTISSLAQGITMVYVPMESLPRSKSAAVLNASLEFDPEFSQLVTETEKRSDVTEEGFHENDDADPDNDSLLESFDSVMFKPKNDGGDAQGLAPLPSPSFSSCSTKSSVLLTPPTKANSTKSSNVTVTKISTCPQQIVHSVVTTKLDSAVKKKGVPPPLPPKNPSVLKLKAKLKFNDAMFENIMKRNSSPKPETPLVSTSRQETLRNAVENLENILRPQSTLSQNNHAVGASNALNDLFTASLPNNGEEASRVGRGHEDLFSTRHDTDTEIDAYSSSFLTCGHVLKDDDYSTLSSTTHSPKIDIDLDHSAPVNHISEGEGSSSLAKEKNKSVLQQLRELSILIGGSSFDERDQKRFHPERSGMNMSPIKGFRLHEDDPTRKLSDATDNSADSGKGSGSGSATTSASVSTSESSPQSFQSSPDSLQLQCRELQCHPGLSTPCVFRSDCNECLMFNKPAEGFKKPTISAEICGKVTNSKKMKSLSRKKSKRSISSKILRRKSSKASKSSSTKSLKRKKKHLVLEYCDCSSCGVDAHRTPCPYSDNLPPNPIEEGTSSSSVVESENEKARKVSSGSSSSSHSSVKLNRSVAFRSSSRSSLLRPHNKPSPPSNNVHPSGPNTLFTIEEEESQSVGSKGQRCGGNDAFSRNANFSGDISISRSGTPHWHPSCWLAAADPLHSGWSDLESLYSLNVKADKPLSINGECWTCWQEISEIKRNSENPNGTVDRTKRMFIWLNKRHREFEAAWWEAKKQASIRWVMTKALTHVPKEYLIDPFKESTKSKPTRYRLRDEVVKGLVSGKVYSFALANLYLENRTFSHWEIIKILSRREVYVAQPSDMKLTEGTLRQKPIRIAAHIALIEAIMSLYSKEILTRERITATLFTFGCTVKSETNSPEKLIIAWVNACVMTLKSYIVGTRNHQLTSEKQNRWLQLPKIGEIRDLSDGIGICSLFAMYCSNDMKVHDICVPEPGETLTIYDSISNHTLIQKLCDELFPESIYHCFITDFLYIHGYMKQNVLCFLVDLFLHLEVNPVVRVNRLTHVPIRLDLI